MQRFILQVKGFSFIELLIAMTLGLLLLSGLSALLIRNIKIQRTQFALLSEQHEAIWITRLIARRLHHAGLARCQQGLPLRRENAIHGGSTTLTWRTCLHYHGKKRYLAETLFVANTTRHYKNGQKIPALFLKINGAPRVEIAAEVHQLKLLYGISDGTGKNILHYVSASAVHNWQHVRTVSLQFTIHAVWHETVFFQALFL